jgi:hypothetical protein
MDKDIPFTERINAVIVLLLLTPLIVISLMQKYWMSIQDDDFISAVLFVLVSPMMALIITCVSIYVSLRELFI